MPYYLKFPADQGSWDTNKALVQISGIAGVLQTVKYILAEDMPAQVIGRARYLYDRRRAVDTTADDGSTGWIYQSYDAYVQTANTSNWRINGASVPIESLFSALANDECSFDVGQDPIFGCISFGARFSETESNYSLAVKNITIIDDAGTHTIDMSSSGGTASEFTSTDGAVTLKLFNFSVPACWVFYSSGASNEIAISATLPKITGSLTLNEINPSYVISVSGQLPKITGAITLNEINPVFTVAVAGQLPKLTGSIALNQFANNRQVTVNGILPKLTGTVTLNRIQPNNQASVSGQLPRITASITLRVPDNYPTANPNDYTVSAYLSTDTTINAIIRTETTYAARLN